MTRIRVHIQYRYSYFDSRLARCNLSKKCVVSCLKILTIIAIEFLTITYYLLKSLYLPLLIIKSEISNVIIMTNYSLAVVFPKIYPGQTEYETSKNSTGTSGLLEDYLSHR